MKLYCRLLSAGFLLLSLFVLPAYTQVSTADITGHVTDQQGRVVPGATNLCISRKHKKGK